VKSVLGEFSSGLSICRNKGPQSDLGAPFYQGLPGRATGSLASDLVTTLVLDEQRVSSRNLGCTCNLKPDSTRYCTCKTLSLFNIGVAGKRLSSRFAKTEFNGSLARMHETV